MKKKHIIVLVVILGILLVGTVGYMQVVKPELENKTEEVVAATPIVNEETPMTFSYPSGVDALLMIEPPISTSSENGLKKAYLMMDFQEYIKYTDKGSVGDTPPSISIFAVSYASTTGAVAEIEGAGRVSKIQTWAQQNPRFTAWTLKNTEVEVVEMDGATAIRYNAEGTYKQQVYIVFYQGDMYVFAGQYVDEGGVMQTRFQDLISSVAFN